VIVGFKIKSALKRSVQLSDLVIQHPVVNVRIDQNGSSNLPVPPASASNSHTSVFDLAVEHFQLTNGTILYNDQATPVQADINDLQVESRFDSLRTRCDASISYDKGNVQYGRYAPFAHAFRTRLNATPASFQIESAELTVGSSAAEFQGQASNFSNPVVTGTYKLRIGAGDLRTLSPGIAADGDVILDGQVHYQTAVGRSLLKSIDLHGKLESPSLLLASRQGRVALRKVRGQYQLSNAALQLSVIDADTLGGAIHAAGDIEHLDARAIARVAASLRGISLSQVEHSLKSTDLRGVSLRSTVDGTVNLAWIGPFENLSARSDLRFKAPAVAASERGEKIIPVNGALRTDYSASGNVLTVHSSSLQVPLHRSHCPRRTRRPLAVAGTNFDKRPSRTYRASLRSPVRHLEDPRHRRIGNVELSSRRIARSPNNHRKTECAESPGVWWALEDGGCFAAGEFLAPERCER